MATVQIPSTCVCGRPIPEAAIIGILKGRTAECSNCKATIERAPASPAFTTPPPGPSRRSRARAKTEDAIGRVAEHADPEWLSKAGYALRRVAVRQQHVTSDSVWDEMDTLKLAGPREPRALGPVFRDAAMRGVLKKTDRVVDSRREERNRGSVRVWESLICAAGPTS